MLRVHQITIVGHREGALNVFQRQRLGVLPADAAGGGVAHMAHRHGPSQLVQHPLVKHIPHQTQVLMIGELSVIHRGNPTGFLPPVLQGVESIIGGPGAVPGGIVDAKYSTFFVNGHRHTPFLYGIMVSYHIKIPFSIVNFTLFYRAKHVTF